MLLYIAVKCTTRLYSVNNYYAFEDNIISNFHTARLSYYTTHDIMILVLIVIIACSIIAVYQRKSITILHYNNNK